jgi:hypothetical protein
MNYPVKRRKAASAAKLAKLQGALIEGENSGPSESFDFAAFIAKKKDEAK